MSWKVEPTGGKEACDKQWLGPGVEAKEKPPTVNRFVRRSSTAERGLNVDRLGVGVPESVDLA